MPASLDLVAARRSAGVLSSVGAALARAGYTERLACSWLGAPLVSDARYVIARDRPAWMRRGNGALIALWLAGETVERADLRALDDRQLQALCDVGLLALDGEAVSARVSLVPVRGVYVAADRLDDSDARAIGSPDLSAWNLAACLPPRCASMLDVGCGAGTAALLAARAGARAVGVDVDARALDFAHVSALVNDLAATADEGRGGVRFVEGDLYADISERFSLVCFNAPLLRAPLAGEAPLYLAAPRGQTLAAEFLDGAAARLVRDADAEVLCHTQLSPLVEDAFARLPLPYGLALVFAHATDGTPHALLSLRAAAPARLQPTYRARLRVPLGLALPHLGREALERLHATQALVTVAAGDDAALRAAVMRPAPWLALERISVFDGHRLRERALRFGDQPLGAADAALLERCDGRALADVAATGEEWARLVELAGQGSLVL